MVRAREAQQVGPPESPETDDLAWRTSADATAPHMPDSHTVTVPRAPHAGSLDVAEPDDVILGERGLYCLEERIGWGAMGVVFRARDALRQREVAVKLCREGGRDGAQRFRREAEALLRVGAPHVPRLVESGETEGRSFLVLELLEGIDLHRLVAQHGPLPAQLVRTLLLQLGRALGAVHRAGLVHRDLKPSNVVWAMTPSGGRHARIIDLGLALDLHRDSHEEEHAPCGTPGYIAPEVWDLDARVDHRADI
ncbi:MAG: serine/threonine protein kinase, partial [Myxococcales bacterium]|nr:serine/threonine protein kinase [Myxococcales bacterium]